MMKTGQRIKLIRMPDDPNPIPPGTTGTITSISEVMVPGSPFTQVGVNWDNGRTLMLCVPPDEVEFLGEPQKEAWRE
jgi:hypothetical protein